MTCAQVIEEAKRRGLGVRGCCAPCLEEAGEGDAWGFGLGLAPCCEHKELAKDMGLDPWAEGGQENALSN